MSITFQPRQKTTDTKKTLSIGSVHSLQDISLNMEHSSSTVDISLKALQIKACLLYFEDVFERRHLGKADVIRVLWTPFHSALTHGDGSFVSWLLEKCAQKYAGLPYFMVNAPIDYTMTEASRGAGYLSSISGALEPKEQEILLASHKSPLDWSVDIPPQLQDLCLELPLSLALAGGCHEVLEKLVKDGADPFCQDSREETILHHLVHLCVIAPKQALAGYTYIMYCLSTEYKVELLSMKNKQDLKPLDLAATLGVPEIMQAIINTDGVYRNVVGEYGLCKHVLYDVTDYEGDQAKTHKSLLYYMTDMTEEQLQRANQCQLLSKEPFHTWCKAKTQDNSRGLILYVVGWTIFIMIYAIRLMMFFQAGTINISGIDFPIGMVAFLVLLLEGMHSRSNFREVKTAFSNIYKGQVPVTFTFAYRVIHLVFCFNLLLAIMLSFLDCTYQAVIQSVYVFTAMCAVLSFLFFMQMMTGVGHLLIVTQKMLFDTLIFMVMLFLVYLGFALGLYLLHLNPTNKGCLGEVVNATSTESTEVSQTMFTTFAATLYETFLLMFTVMAPVDIYFEVGNNKQKHNDYLAL